MKIRLLLLIVDYPMYEKDELSNKIKFSHNPFSMPRRTKTNKFEKTLIFLHINMILSVMV